MIGDYDPTDWNNAENPYPLVVTTDSGSGNWTFALSQFAFGATTGNFTYEVPDNTTGSWDTTGCILPFTYYGVSYDTCTNMGTGGTGTYPDYWCATKVNEEGAFVVGSGND